MADRLSLAERRHPTSRWLTSKDARWLLAWYGFGWFARRWPAGLSRASERVLERIYVAVRPAKRRSVAARMRQVLPLSQDAAWVMAGQLLRHNVRRSIDEHRLGVGRTCATSAAITIHGRAHLDAALSAGRGVILVSAHRFAAARAVATLGELGYPILVVKNPRVRGRHGKRFRSHIAKRHQQAIHRIYTDIVSPDDPEVSLTLLRRVRAGGIVFITPDVSRPASAVRVPFLKGQLSIATGALAIARLSGSPILTIESLYDSAGVRIEFGAPLPLRRDGAPSDFIRDNMPPLASFLEQQILTCPEQWMMWGRPR